MIDEDVHLPVVSVAIDDKYLFDDYIGIYTIGKNSSGQPNPEDHIHANYDQPWYRPGSIEYIKDGKSQFSNNIGIKIHGNFSSAYANKSLAIYAKKRFGTSAIEYPLFEQKPFIKKVKSFILRNSGNDWKDTMIRDGLFHTLVKDQMDIDYAAYQPTVVFLNGKYWGIMNIREKENENYLKDNHRVDPDNVDLLENADYEVLAGDNRAYKNLISFVKSHNLAINTNYNTVAKEIDIDEFINYMITEIYVANTDWLGKNIRYWRERKDGAQWRWLLQDLDFGFGLMVADDVFHNTLDFATRNNTTKTILLRSLLQNNQFKSRFASRFFTHLNSTFAPNRVTTMIDLFKNRIQDEMPRDIQRWKNQGRRINSYNAWLSKINGLKKYANQRAEIVKNQLMDKFNLTGNNTLHITKASEGEIYLDNIHLESSYNGTYFDNAVVSLKAVPHEGYRFVQWSDGNTAQTREVTLTGNLSLSAQFEAAPMPKIVINEINYKSDKNHDSGDWIELYNNDTATIDLSGWSIKDDSLSEGYTIPTNTILPSHGYLVICEDKVKFQTQYNISAPVIGDFPFGLSKSEESVKLYNAQGALIDSVHYDKSWPDARGNGKTLSLIDPASDNSLSTNWVAADNFGTPGEGN